ncbi:MAG: putative PurR-regulated permease PerM [Paraglaciecola sp.]|jgi:predicted PurR-regulated permease PerM
MSDMSDAKVHEEQDHPHNVKMDNAGTLRWLLAFAALYTLYFAQTLLVPLVVTSLIALLLSPLVALFKRVHIPRGISALLLLTALLTPFTFVAVELAQPAQKWAQMLPKLSEHLTQQIDSISDAIEGEEAVAKRKEREEKSTFSFFDFFKDDEPQEPVAQKPEQQNVVTERIKQGGIEILISALGATPLALAQLMTGIILILFLLIFGPSLFSAFVNGVPKVKDKKRVIELVNTIQKELSRYIVTVSIINSALGAATALTLHLMGMEDALLWGVLAGLLNFIPYVGSMIGVVILSMAGLVEYGIEVSALLPPLAYLVLNLIESQFITPTVLGHHMQLNPLVVMLWLLILGWLWGGVGVLLAVPLLVCIKLTLAQLNVCPDWLKIIETRG